MVTNIFAIKINDRYLSEIKNKRLSTAWSIIGAKMFFEHHLVSNEEFEKIKDFLIGKRKKFKKVFIGEVERKEEKEYHFTPDDYSDLEDLPF